MPYSPQTWQVRIAEDGILELPEEVLDTLGWAEDDDLECIVINLGEQLIIRKTTVSTQNASAPTHQIVDFGPGPQDTTVGYPFQGTEQACISWLEHHQEVRPDDTNRFVLQDIPDDH